MSLWKITKICDIWLNFNSRINDAFFPNPMSMGMFNFNLKYIKTDIQQTVAKNILLPFTLFWEKQIWLVNACQNCYFRLPVTFRGEKPAIPALFPIIPLHPAHFSRNHNRSAWCAGNQRKDLRHNPDKAISTPVLWKIQSKFNQKLKTNLFYL